MSGRGDSGRKPRRAAALNRTGDPNLKEMTVAYTEMTRLMFGEDDLSIAQMAALCEDMAAVMMGDRSRGRRQIWAGKP